jgi:hypothetical protein
MGRFSDSPHFLLKLFFDGINNTQPITVPTYNFDWLVKFVSSFDNGDGTRTFNDDSYTFANTDNNISNIVFTDYNANSWNLELSYDANIVKTFNSYIVAPMINITTNGGGLFNLFIKEEDIGFLPIKVRYENRDGNEFNFINSGIMDVEPGENITDVLSGLRYMFVFWDKVTRDTFGMFENNREAYFRKDSLYHEWLGLMAKDQILDEMGIDLEIRNYANTDKIFHYFHNIFKSHDNQKCRIIFDGMKDYVMRAVPEHQRTTRFTELCNIFFDQLYQEIFDLMKNVWSLIDPMEVDQKYLGYLSRYYDMFDVDINGASLLQIREFVRDMIWMIKRKGTYTEFYILWRILTSTKNILNIYERWHRRDVEMFPDWPSTISPSCTGTWPNFPYFSNTNNTTNVPPSAWVDVLYVYRDEYEAPQISGGAGQRWYEKWYPDVYEPIYISPSGQYCPSGGFIHTAPAPSGDNLMLSTHYILETDITTEPLTFSDILTADVWDSMYSYWEYVRPVNRVSNYRILIAPITDTSGKYIHLYDVTTKSTAFLKTKSYVSLSLEEDSYVHHQTNPSDIWNINHNLGEDILLQVFDENFNEIVPKDITFGVSTATLVFDIPEAGFAIMRKANWTSTHPLPVLSETWRFYHLRHQKEIIVQYKYGNKGFYSKNIELTDSNYADAEFSDTEQNTVLVGTGNKIFTQTTDSEIWNIPHNLSTKGVIMAVYTHDNIRVHPDQYRLVDGSNCKLVFNSLMSGYVVLYKVGDLSLEDFLEELETLVSSLSYTIYTHNSDGEKIIVETGYYVKVYRDDNYYYFDIIVDKDSSFVINEIDIFDVNGDKLINSIMSDLYKPQGVDMVLHYRLILPVE